MAPRRWLGGLLALLLLAAPSSARAAAPDGWFLDPARGAIAFEPAYRAWFGEPRREPQRARNAVELTGLLAIGTAYYWVFPGLNRIDWITPDIETKLLEPKVTFDNNMHRTNHLLHPFAGSLSYWFSRTNGLGPWESAGWSLASSAAFEFVLEFRETASINDMMFTPGAGIPSGELFFHLADYLTSAPGAWGPARTALAATLGLPNWAHDSVDGTHGRPPSTPDPLGYASAYWHRFVLGLGASSLANDRRDQVLVRDVVAEVDLAAMPGFLRPGRFSTGFDEGNFTSMRLRASVGPGGLTDVDLRMSADLAGRYAQDLDGTPDALRGEASRVAANASFRYVDRWLLGRRDMFAMVHLFGPSVALWYGLGGGAYARVEGDLHVDFTGMGSPAYQRWLAAWGPGGTKSVLAMHGYYLGIGGSGRVAATAGWGPMSLVGRASYGAYRSVDGADQSQANVDHDDTNVDRIFELGAFAEAAPPDAPILLRLGWERWSHASEMGPFSVEWTDQRASLLGALRF